MLLQTNAFGFAEGHSSRLCLANGLTLQLAGSMEVSRKRMPEVVGLAGFTTKKGQSCSKARC